MGKIVQLRRASDAVLAELALGGPNASHFIDPDLEDSARGDGSILGIGTSWHVIHFLLTDEHWSQRLPQGFLLAGKRVGEDVVVGPAHWLNSAEVALVDQHLKSLPEDFISKKFDFDKIQASDIYPFVWDSRDPAIIDHATHHFSQLRAFVSEAVARGQGIAHVILVNWADATIRSSDIPSLIVNSDALTLCSSAGIGLDHLESAGWVMQIGMDILNSALVGDEREMFAGYDIVVGILHTNKGCYYSYSSEKGAVLVSSTSPHVIVASYRRT